MTIKIYSAKHCRPCHQVIRLLENQGGVIDGEEVKVIDIETDEGFAEFSKDILERGDTAIPYAYKDGEHCRILIEDDKIIHLHCPSSEGQSLESPPSSEKD